MMPFVACVISSLMLTVSVADDFISKRRRRHFIKFLSKLVGKSPLPPLKFRDQITLFLDLDETLIHSVESSTPPSKYDFVVKGRRHVYYVLKRPFVDEFLRFLSEEKKFQVVIFTAAKQSYASSILGKLDPKGLIAHRLYQSSTKILNGELIKDISGFGRDLNKVLIIDDQPRYYRLQPKNAIPIKPFIDDLEDKELIRLMNYFKSNNFLKKIQL